MELAGDWSRSRPARRSGCGTLTGGDPEREAELQRRVGEAASRAIAAGLSLASIADAERIGQGRAREKLGPELLRGVERALRRRCEAECEYEQTGRPRRAAWPRASGTSGGSAGDARHRARGHRPHAHRRRAARRVIHDRGPERVWAAAGKRVWVRRCCGRASVSGRHAGWGRGSSRNSWCNGLSSSAGVVDRELRQATITAGLTGSTARPGRRGEQHRPTRARGGRRANQPGGRSRPPPEVGSCAAWPDTRRRRSQTGVLTRSGWWPWPIDVPDRESMPDQAGSAARVISIIVDRDAGARRLLPAISESAERRGRRSVGGGPQDGETRSTGTGCSGAHRAERAGVWTGGMWRGTAATGDARRRGGPSVQCLVSSAVGVGRAAHPRARSRPPCLSLGSPAIR